MDHPINQLARQLMQDFCSGTYPLNAQLPSEQELKERWHCNRYHLYYALAKLQERGIIERRKKSGTRLVRLPRPFEIKFMDNEQSNRIVLWNHFRPVDAFSHIHYNARLLNSLRKKLHAEQLELEIHDNSSEDLDECQTFAQGLCQNDCQALVLISGNHINNFAEMLFHLHNRIFIFNRGGDIFDDNIFNKVSINNFADGVTAAETALGRGGNKLIFCSLKGEENNLWLNERRRGVSYGAYRFLGTSFFCDNFVMGQHGSFPLKHREPDTVLIAANDEMAAHYIQAGQKCGFRPGRDYKLISFGDDERYHDLGLTTLAPDLETIGAELAAGIISGLHNPTNILFSASVKSKLIWRQTL